MINVRQRFQSFFCVSEGERKFKKFIRKISKNHFVDFPEEHLILVEGHQTSTNIVALTTLLPVLKRRYKANVCGYFTEPDKTIIQKIRNRLRFQFSIIKRIAPGRPLFVNNMAPHTPELKKFLEDFDGVSQTKSGFEGLKYREILIGDLVYDNYLRRTRRLTLELSDPELINYLIETCNYLDRFLDYLSNNKVKAIVVTHMVYNFAIPARVGLVYGIDVFLCTAEVLYKVTDKNYFAYDTHKDFPQLYSNLDITCERQYLDEAEKRLKSRLMGNLNDLPYFKSYPSSASFNLGDLQSNEDSLFLVALHDFSDSPHVFGNSLFPDFYEWLRAIGEFSLANDINFLVKPHPNSLFNQLGEITELVKFYPNLKLVDSNVSNYELGKLNLNGCLTVYGTIAHEMAYLGVPVINACINNPHASYSFCYTPKSVSEWKEIIQRLAISDQQVEITAVLQYYFMNYIYHPISWILENYSGFITQVGSYREPDPDKTFKALENQDYSYNFDSLQQSIQNFLNSEDLRFSKVHMVVASS